MISFFNIDMIVKLIGLPDTNPYLVCLLDLLVPDSRILQLQVNLCYRLDNLHIVPVS